MSKSINASGTVVKVSREMSPAEQIKAMDSILSNPLTLLPLEWRPATMGFWMRWTHLIKDGMLTLCMRVNDYRHEGLTLSELQGVFGRVNKAERVKPFQFSADVFGAVVGQVNDILRRKKSIQQAAAGREAEKDAGNNQFVRSLASSFPKI